MSTATPRLNWQNAVHGSGMIVFTIGLLWGLYRAYIQHACPAGPFNDLVVIAAGMAIAAAPLHPLTPASRSAYLAPWLGQRKLPAIALWLLAVLCALAGVVLMSTTPPPQHWMGLLVVPAVYLWFGLRGSFGQPGPSKQPKEQRHAK